MSRSSKQLSLEWTKGLEGKEKTDMQDTVRHSTIVLTQILRVVDDKLATLERTEISPDMYEDSSYPFKQAHINGKRASLEEIRRLLDFIES